MAGSEPADPDHDTHYYRVIRTNTDYQCNTRYERTYRMQFHTADREPGNDKPAYRSRDPHNSDACHTERFSVVLNTHIAHKPREDRELHRGI